MDPTKIPLDSVSFFYACMPSKLASSDLMNQIFTLLLIYNISIVVILLITLMVGLKIKSENLSDSGLVITIFLYFYLIVTRLPIYWNMEISEQMDFQLVIFISTTAIAALYSIFGIYIIPFYSEFFSNLVKKLKSTKLVKRIVKFLYNRLDNANEKSLNEILHQFHSTESHDEIRSVQIVNLKFLLLSNANDCIFFREPFFIRANQFISNLFHCF
jgi:hypothetical protein